MEKTKFNKKQQKLIKNISKELVDEIYFNPKRRIEIRKAIVEGQKSFLEMVESPLKPNSSIQDLQNKAWAEEFLDQMTKMIDSIDNVVPRKLKEMEIINSLFELYEKQKGKYVVIRCNYEKGIPKKHYLAHILIPFGFPKKGKRTKARMIRGDYDLKGFALKDKGMFTQRFISFENVELKFKGENINIKFGLTQRGKILDRNWLRVKN